MRLSARALTCLALGVSLSLSCDSNSDPGSTQEPGSSSGSSGSGGESAVGAGGEAAHGAGAGGETAIAAGAGGDEGSAEIPILNGCSAEAYEDHTAPDDARVVAMARDGLVFTPKCMLIAASQTVTFEGSFASHPLSPGSPGDAMSGSPNNPIAKTSSGSSKSFEFPSTGTFPFFCELHAFGEGRGMAGVIHVR